MPGNRNRRMLVFVAVLLALPPLSVFADQKIETIAVLNFVNRAEGDAGWSWLNTGLADLIIGDMASQGLRIVSREQMAALVRELEIKNQNEDPDAIARVLKATRCVSGSFLVTGGRVDLNATLIDSATGALLHTGSASGSANEVLTLEKKLAAELVEVLTGKRAGSIDPGSLPRWTESVPASQLLYQGVDKFDRGEFFDAWILFRRALRQDATYADALYWSGRMTYYLQEYHHAVTTFESFVRSYPKHPRAGDAVMETINSAQITARKADEVMGQLKLAVQVAPRAEVHNQFATGVSSNVAVYCAGLAAQILKPQGHLEEAFHWYEKALATLKPDDEVYRYVWKQMLKLALAHLAETGELLPLSQPPRLLPHEGKFLEDSAGRRILINGPATQGAGDPTVDDFLYQHEFLKFSPQKRRVESRFGKGGFKLPAPRYHFYVPRGYFLTSLAIRPSYDAGGYVPGDLRIAGEDITVQTELTDQGPLYRLQALPEQRVVSASFVHNSNPRAESYPITGLELVAELQSEDRTAALLLEPPQDFAFRVTLNKLLITIVDKPTRYAHLPPGHIELKCEPHITGRNKAVALEFDIAADEEAHVRLACKADPRRRLRTAGFFDQRVISTPYEPFRMGVGLGTRPDELPGEVKCLRDRRGRDIAMWTMRRDLYMVTSRDSGRTWTPTMKLPAPVTSAHDDKVPLLFEDEAGRYILCFVSDRNLERAPCTYVCWTDDLVHFSSPRRLCTKASMPVGVFQRDDGSYLVYMFVAGTKLHPPGNRDPGDSWLVTSSSDLVQWTQPEEFLRVPAPKRIEDLYPQLRRSGRSPIMGIPDKQPLREDVPSTLKIEKNPKGFLASCQFFGWGDKNPPYYASVDGLRFDPIRPQSQRAEFTNTVVNGAFKYDYPELTYFTTYKQKQYAAAFARHAHYTHHGIAVLEHVQARQWQQVGYWNPDKSENEAETSKFAYQGAGHLLISNQFSFGGLIVNDTSLSLLAIPDVRSRTDRQATAVDPWSQPAQPLVLVRVPRDRDVLTEHEKVNLSQQLPECSARLMYRKMPAKASHN